MDNAEAKLKAAGNKNVSAASNTNLFLDIPFMKSADPAGQYYGANYGQDAFPNAGPPKCYEKDCQCELEHAPFSPSAGMELYCYDCGAYTKPECVCASSKVHMYQPTMTAALETNDATSLWACAKCGKTISSPIHATHAHPSYCVECDSTDCECGSGVG